MASVLKVDELKGNSTAGNIAVTGEGNSTTTNLQAGAGKAWVECNMMRADTLCTTASILLHL